MYLANLVVDIRSRLEEIISFQSKHNCFYADVHFCCVISVRFLRIGLRKTRTEWDLQCTWYNLQRPTFSCLLAKDERAKTCFFACGCKKFLSALTESTSNCSGNVRRGTRTTEKQLTLSAVGAQWITTICTIVRSVRQLYDDIEPRKRRHFPGRFLTELPGCRNE